MDYLKKFFTEQEYLQIKQELSEETQTLFLTSEKKVCENLNLLKHLNINILNVILDKSNILFDNLEFLKEKILQDPQLLVKLQEDVANFDTIGL